LIWFVRKSKRSKRNGMNMHATRISLNHVAASVLPRREKSGMIRVAQCGCIVLLGFLGGCTNPPNTSSHAPAPMATQQFAARQPRVRSAAEDLLIAEMNGDAAAVQAALDKGAPDPVEQALDVNNAKKGLGDTRLIWAAGLGHLSSVMSLIDEGADVNAKGIEGRTALISAVINNHADCVKVLLDAGADANARDNYGKTAYDHLDKYSPPYIADALRAAEAKTAPSTHGPSASPSSPDTAKDDEAGLGRQVVLAKIASRDPDFRVRRAALTKLKDQALLAKLAGNTNQTTADSVEAVARLCLALKDPVVIARIPDAKLTLAWANSPRNYYPTTTYSTGISIGGENLIILIRQGSRTLASGTWRTDFPPSVNASVNFIPVTVQTSAIIGRLLSQPEFAREDLLKLAESRIPEVRAGASQNLH
jgi:hypothetical protein